MKRVASSVDSQGTGTSGAELRATMHSKISNVGKEESLKML